jgi:hypothetical protein
MSTAFSTWTRALPVALLCVWLAILAGCGSVAQTTRLEPGFVPQKTFSVTVGDITSESPPVPDDEKVELDPLQALRTALTKKLAEHEIPSVPSSTGAQYVLVSTIREYRPGSAFKRWLMPGYGSTILWVESELREGDKKVAESSNKRTVDAGGAYTAGAYESIFADVAGDIVVGLKEKLAAGQ